MCSHIQMILKLYRLCHMNCLLCGVMCDNQVCNLFRSYRGPLRCIWMIYGQLYLTIIAILQNMCTGIRSYIDTTGCIVTAHAFSYYDILLQKTCSLGVLVLLVAVGYFGHSHFFLHLLHTVKCIKKKANISVILSISHLRWYFRLD